MLSTHYISCIVVVVVFVLNLQSFEVGKITTFTWQTRKLRDCVTEILYNSVLSIWIMACPFLFGKCNCITYSKFSPSFILLSVPGLLFLIQYESSNDLAFPFYFPYFCSKLWKISLLLFFLTFLLTFPSLITWSYSKNYADLSFSFSCHFMSF